MVKLDLTGKLLRDSEEGFTKIFVLIEAVEP
jgi:hypothetical protein